MKSFSIEPITVEQRAYDYLTEILHPAGLQCPTCHTDLPADQAPHARTRAPLVNYRCRNCGCVYNLFSNTMLSGTHYSCVTVVLLLHYFVMGRPTTEIATELDLDYGTVLKWRHRFQDAALAQRITAQLPDKQTEIDETYVNAGQPGEKKDPDNAPPRQRANQQRGRGTAATDRPPIVGTVGRDSDQVRLAVTRNAQTPTLRQFTETYIAENSTVYTDDNPAYQFLEATPRQHFTVAHSAHEFACDADGDGINEVHDNTIEGLWTGLKNFLRPFRGVHQKYLPQYVAMFEWLQNLETVTHDFLRMLLIPDFTYSPI